MRRLLADGARVRVLDDMSRGDPRRLAGVLGDIELVAGDIRDASVVRQACQGVEGVAHLAYVNGTEFFYSKPDVVLEVAVRGMLNVLAGCREAGVDELLLASSSEVYQTPPAVPTDETAPLVVPDPLNPRYSYGGGKIISELMSLHIGGRHLERVVIARPHNVFGADMGWQHVVPQFAVRLKQLAETVPTGPLRLPIQGTGRETRAFIHIDDFTDALALVMRAGENRNVYHIGTMEETSIETVAREVGRCFGRDVEVVPGELQPGSPVRRCPDTAKLKSLGFEPRLTFREALGPVVRWYDEHPEKGFPDHAALQEG